MSAVVTAVLIAISLRPSPSAVGYSLQAGRCFEQVPPGTTELRSTLAVGASARLSTTFRFSRLCGGHGNPIPCSAAPLRVTAAGGLTVASVRGTDIQIKARTVGAGEIAVRARKKQFPPLALHAALPVALMARVSSFAIAFAAVRGRQARRLRASARDCVRYAMGHGEAARGPRRRRTRMVVPRSRARGAAPVAAGRDRAGRRDRPPRARAAPDANGTDSNRRPRLGRGRRSRRRTGEAVAAGGGLSRPARPFRPPGGGPGNERGGGRDPPVERGGE